MRFACAEPSRHRGRGHLLTYKHLASIESKLCYYTVVGAFSKEHRNTHVSI